MKVHLSKGNEKHTIELMIVDEYMLFVLDLVSKEYNVNIEPDKHIIAS